MDNKYSVYRQIRHDRTYRTLGKMSWWRIVLGIVLIILVLLISGFISQQFAARGQFHIAEKLMIAPEWMEEYKPDTKAFIEAGVLYQDGEFEAAAEAFDSIETVDAAEAMKSLSYVKLASEKLADGEMDAAYDALIDVDFALLSEDDGQEYLAVCVALREHYSLAESTEAQKRDQTLQGLLDAQS